MITNVATLKKHYIVWVYFLYCLILLQNVLN